MLILHVTYKMNPNQREDFVHALIEQRVQEITEAENGNIQYRFAIPIDAADELLITEMWENQESLEAHFAGEPIKALKEVKAAYGVETTEMKKYEI